jgi:hypothetical protein
LRKRIEKKNTFKIFLTQFTTIYLKALKSFFCLSAAPPFRNSLRAFGKKTRFQAAQNRNFPESGRSSLKIILPIKKSCFLPFFSPLTPEKRKSAKLAKIFTQKT